MKRVVVTGLIGQYALGGVVWDYLQYLLGFRRLGYDVWYLEDTGMWPYHREREEICDDCSSNVAHLREVMEEFDLGDRWLYRNEPDGHYHGCVRDDAGAEKILSDCHALINVSGACWLREANAKIPHKIFVDGDPMFTQINLLRDPDGERMARMKAHTAHFSFGLKVGKPGCLVPAAGFEWKPTVQPVDISSWENIPTEADNASAGAWTTVMNWVSYPPVEFEGKSYGQKDGEFLKFVDLPETTGLPFALAMGRGQGNLRPTERLEGLGWRIHEPLEVIPDHRAYQRFLGNSRGEWSVAKNGYVQANTGWFSCRTACYLAAGRPAVVQDTGWTDHLPAGEGVLAFRTPQDAADALRAIETNYAFHAQAARDFASKHFDAAKVCDELLTTA
jgi:hypothetical protein